jgi:hypothetical protein
MTRALHKFQRAILIPTDSDSYNNHVVEEEELERGVDVAIQEMYARLRR